MYWFEELSCFNGVTAKSQFPTKRSIFEHQWEYISRKAFIRIAVIKAQVFVSVYLNTVFDGRVYFSLGALVWDLNFRS